MPSLWSTWVEPKATAATPTADEPAPTAAPAGPDRRTALRKRATAGALGVFALAWLAIFIPAAKGVGDEPATATDPFGGPGGGGPPGQLRQLPQGGQQGGFGGPQQGGGQVDPVTAGGLQPGGTTQDGSLDGSGAGGAPMQSRQS